MKIENMTQVNTIENNLIQFASPKDLKNKKFCIDLVKKDPINYSYLPESMKMDFNIIKTTRRSVSNENQLFQFYEQIPQDLINNLNFCNFLLEISLGEDFQHFPPQIQNNDFIAENAITLLPTNIQYASFEIQTNSLLVRKLLEEIKSFDSCKTFVNLIQPSIIDKELTEQIAEKMLSSFHHLSPELRSNVNMIKSYIENPRTSTSTLPNLLNNMLPLARRKQFKKLVKDYSNKSNQEARQIFLEACNIFKYEDLRNEISIKNNEPKSTKIKI